MDCIFVYLDNILVASNTVEKHHIHLEEVFKRLQQHGLVLHLEKCVFFTSSVEFLGQHMSAEGIRPLGARVAAIAAHPRPGTKSQLMSFLGMLNFYRRYLRGAASILKPLTDATRGAGGKHSKLEWTKVMGKAFLAAKAALTDAAHLAHPLQEVELSQAVDASNHQVGAALQQRSPGGEWQPLSFFSRKLTNTETRYSTFNRELLTVVAALRLFRFLLEGRSFHVLTNHKPLVFALHRARDA